MPFIAGDMEEVVCSHPDLGDFRFACKANESATIDEGGIRNADDASNVTAAGNVIRQKNRVAWSVEVTIAADLANMTEETALNKLAESTVEGVWTFGHISGMLRKGTGQPVGDIQVDTNNAQIKMKISGGGKLEQI